jgi:hypothetical protein
LNLITTPHAILVSVKLVKQVGDELEAVKHQQ